MMLLKKHLLVVMFCKCISTFCVRPCKKLQLMFKVRGAFIKKKKIKGLVQIKLRYHARHQGPVLQNFFSLTSLLKTSTR